MALSLRDRLLGRLAQLVFVALFYTVFCVFCAVLLYPYVFPVRPWPAFSDFLLRSSSAFESANCVYESPVVFDRVLFLFMPHGVFSWGYLLNGGLLPVFRPHKGVVATVLHYLPLFRYLVLWTGATMPASKSAFVSAMRRGESFGLVPGGFEEAAITQYGVDRVYVGQRAGFIKYALQYGYSLQPVYTFGETRTYKTASGMAPSLRLRLARAGIPGVLFWGSWWLPLMPLPARLYTVVGAPMKLPRIENPTREQVLEWRNKFLEHVVDLYDRHKEKYYGPGCSAKLEVL
eukprot:m51a1_g10897 hypothetical protein (289) ;mRNA; r:27850-29022